MTQHGFKFLELSVVGTGKRPATVSFREGLNVISGASETGKTYIFECIDFVLGGKTPPPPIPEANGYDQVQLQLESYEGALFRLERGLTGGQIRCVPLTFSAEGAEADLYLSERHASDSTKSLSSFLLKLSGLNDKRVRTNQFGSTKDVSFRNRPPLFCG
jgi:AAA domain